ncbi:hypothetical protein MKX01_020951 [Papaver californicum]|nr:hypothetical protein MKX01_020951 [Papaver californicum]
MAWKIFFSVILFFALAELATSNFISGDVLDASQGSTGRTLLQAKKGCSVDFENMNYTIITSQCKGPQYPAKQCCAALLEFMCPFADQINDLNSDCATTAFSYINLYGKYPPGLFANECHGGKDGLDCPDSSPPGKSSSSISLPCRKTNTAASFVTAAFSLILVLCQ